MEGFNSHLSPDIYNFDLGPDLYHYPNRGSFPREHLIGRIPTHNIIECKKVCNKLDSCKGITWKVGSQCCDTPRCYLFNDNSEIIKTPYAKNNFISWRNFYNKLY